MPITALSFFYAMRSGWNPVGKVSTIYPISHNMPYSKKVQSNSLMNDFVDPRFEEDAIAALMEEAFSETRDDKFDVEKFIEGDLDY